MKAGHVFTCPHCRAIVDYSCMCPQARDIKEFVAHQTVYAAKSWVEAARVPEPVQEAML